MSSALRIAILLASCVATATSVAAPLRPQGAPGGETVAEVHVRVGAGSLLRAGGRDYPATPGTALLADDELVVPAGQVLVVQLRNGYLVRLDDDVSLHVSQIVLINAPHTKESFGSQLDRLLTKEEQGRAERIAGVHAQVGGAMASGIEQSAGAATESRKRAAQPSGPGATPDVQPTPTGDLSGPARRGAPRQTTATAATPPPATQTMPPAKDSGPPPAAPIEIAKPSPVSKRPPRDEESSSEKTAKKAAPSPLPKERALRSCLTRELGKLPVHVDVAQLRLFLSSGKVARASLGGGLLLPACATKLLVGAKVDGADGWLDRDLSLR